MIFEPLPGDRGAALRQQHQANAAELRSRPGEWARVSSHPNPEAAACAAAGIRGNGRRRIRAYSDGPGRFEATARTVDGEHRVYARYIAPDAPQQ